MLVSAGTCTIDADQPGDGTFDAAPTATQSFAVTKVPQTISFTQPPDTALTGGPVALSATATSGLPVSFISTTTGVCTVSGSSVTLVSAGTCTIDADQPGDGTFDLAPTATRSFAVTKGMQSIAFAQPPDTDLASGPVTLSGTATSGLPVAFTSLTTGTCTVSGSSVTLVSVGTCTISAGQAGDGNYDPAASVMRSFAVQSATVGFAKAFAPDVLGGGAVSTLAFTIDNSANAVVATALDFTDALPGGVQVASPSNASTTCTGGTLTAASGAGVVGYTGGAVGARGTCTVQVDVVAPVTPGSYVNMTGALTSSLGVHGTASDTLTVEPPPIFAKTFAPDAIAVGGASTLTFAVDNSASTLPAGSLGFTDALPAGVHVATPANASTTCTGGTLTAASGAGAIGYSGGSVAAGANCTIQADVTSDTPGAYVNTTGDLTSSLGNSGTATDTLTVTATPPTFAKAFATSPVGVGTPSTLTFTIDNSVNAAPAGNLDFTDVFPAGLVVATPANASTTCTGGTFTAAAGAGTVSYTGGTAPAGAACTIQVNVAAATPGNYINTTGNLISSLGNSGTATDTLSVEASAIGFAKAFATSPVDVGVVSTLTFTIDNGANAVAATGLAFDDPFPVGLVVATPANASTTCTGGSFSAPTGANSVSYAGGSVAASATCTLTVDVVAHAPGSYVNTTGALASSLGTQGTATDTLTVGATALGFAKAFVPDSIVVGGVTTLTFTIDNSANAAAATALAFSDDLPAGLQLAATPRAATTCSGGALTAAAGGASIAFAGGSVGAGGTCIVQVDITATVVGTYTNTSEALTSSFGASGAATATLSVNQDPAVVIAQTQQVISNFMNTRADLMTIQDPDLSLHLETGGAGPPVDVNAYFDPDRSDFSFATSLSRLAYAAGTGERQAGSEALAALGYTQAAPTGAEAPRFDIWAEGSYTTFNDTAAGADMDGRFGLLYVGAEYRLGSNLLVGALGQFDWTAEKDDNTGIGADGIGWMAGPYVVGRLGDSLYLQARGAWGVAENEVTPFGTYADSFNSTRWLVSGKVTGRFHAGQWRFSPTAGLIYFQEEQHAYVDSNGLTIPSQSVALGRATFGPEVGYRVNLDGGGYLESMLGITGVFDFDEDGKTLGGFATTADSLRAKVSGGFSFQGPGGAKFGISGFYDGVGDENFEAYGGKANLVVPFD